MTQQMLVNLSGWWYSLFILNTPVIFIFCLVGYGSGWSLFVISFCFLEIIAPIFFSQFLKWLLDTGSPLRVHEWKSIAFYNII